MYRLIIDDLRTFKFPDSDNTVHARTLFEALFVMDSRWDEVWWDFDMGPGPTTCVLAETIIDQPQLYHIGLNVIHTANPVGAVRLEEILSPHWPVRRATFKEIWNLLDKSV